MFLSNLYLQAGGKLWDSWRSVYSPQRSVHALPRLLWEAGHTAGQRRKLWKGRIPRCLHYIVLKIHIDVFKVVLSQFFPRGKSLFLAVWDFNQLYFAKVQSSKFRSKSKMASGNLYNLYTELQTTKYDVMKRYNKVSNRKTTFLEIEVEFF